MTSFTKVGDIAGRVLSSVGEVVVGKDRQTEMLLMCLSVSGHVLLEDVPGVGKTLLARTFAAAVGLSFGRIQFTPDLLPSDVTGVNVYNQKTGDFTWRPGPIFANIVLADELNRATPRTQSSLLEAMEERQVTVDGVTRALPRPFIVIATQNPIEMEGTFPLPEAQIDRFLTRIEMGYPSRQEELAIVSRFQGGDASLGTITRAVTPEDLETISAATKEVYIGDDVARYLLDIVERTRQHPALALGASPRGALYFARLAKARAAIDGRGFVTPDDVKAVAIPSLAHRLIPKTESVLRGNTSREVLGQILDEAAVPVGGPDGHKIP